MPTPGADALAVSQGWLAYRAKLKDGGDGIFARSIAHSRAPSGRCRRSATIGDPAQLSPPSLDGGLLLYGVARAAGQPHRPARARHPQAPHPDPLGLGAALQPGREGAPVRLRANRRAGQQADGPQARQAAAAASSVFGVRRSRGMLTSTALTEGRAYVTLLHPSATEAGAEVIEVPLKGKKKKKKKKRKR